MAMKMSSKLLSSSIHRLSRFGRSFCSIPSMNAHLVSRHSSGFGLLHQSSRGMVGWWQRPFSGTISKMCGQNTCCRIHTENDKNLLAFLSEEVRLETENQKKLPNITDFAVVADESTVTLTKKLGEEKIIVKFNVNHSVNSSEMTEDDSKDAQMVSKPPFTVEVQKGGNTLAMSCVFTEDVADPQSGEQYADTLEIEEVCFHSGEWTDDTYAVSASIMDGNLYDHLLNLLEDRGIDEQFVEQLIEYSTNYEHQKYINFLHNLQGFVKQ